MKICGISRVEEAQAAVRAGANAVGFVFADGPRKVSPAQAAEIGPHVHPSVWKIGVFVDASYETIEGAVNSAGLDGVQLHGSEDLEIVGRLRDAFPTLIVFKAIKMNGRDSGQGIRKFADHVDAVLLDRKDVGNPERKVDPLPHDWLQGLSLDRVIVAGGLTPQNVSQLVRDLKPWGVDASGGLEVRPGAKDRAKITAFVRAVREA